MENDTFGGALLAWVKSAKAFLKVQAGAGDNLLEEDIREGFTDYCLWSTFRPECIDTDGELDMECLDSGMVLFRGKMHPRRGAGIELPASLRHRLRQGRLLRHPERNVVESKNPVGEASPCLQPLCPRVPQTVIPAQAGISFPIRVQTVFRTPPLLRAPPLKPQNIFAVNDFLLKVW